MTLLNRKFKDMNDTDALEVKATSIKQVIDTTEFEASPSYVHDLQNQIENQLNSFGNEEIAIEKIPLKWTIIGLISFCSVFWIFVFSLFK